MALSVLQLDTRFPRVPGDVACAQTFVEPPEIIEVPRATVARVVTDDPKAVDLTAFRDAARKAKGRVVTTSCGFLAPFQEVLQRDCRGLFVASALGALRRLESEHGQGRVLVVTFDAQKLGDAFLPAKTPRVGLSPDMHLRKVIEGDLPDLDTTCAQSELVDLLLRAVLQHDPSAILLECTNLPPYKTALRTVFGGPFHDILTEIERVTPGSVRKEWR
ncbi:MAG: hypothetical protein AAF393_04920 [Pseudomonadota bacterium]